MVCPLCGERRARRACPALNQQICPVCCGTKRLTQIRCPSDCAYLSSSREHPPAVALRRQQHDIQRLVQHLRDLNERQSRLFLVVATFLTQYEPPELQALADEDIAEAAAAVASTLETAARGVIYEHRPAAPAAERLASGLKAVLAEAGADAGAGFERDAAVVLRRVAEAARADDKGDKFLELLRRVIRRPDAPDRHPPGTGGSRIIVP